MRNGKPDGSSGPGMSDIISLYKADDAPVRKCFLKIIEKIEREPTILGVSPHLMGIVRKRAERC